MTRSHRTVLLALLLALGSVAHAVSVVPLNDTGQTLCYDSAGTVISCASSGTDDGRYGRDAANTAGQLSKTGAGSAGFDFSKIANNGTLLPASATLGSNPTDWACTRDNVTGLTWEVKTTSGLRSSAHNYTWYSTDTTSNGGDPGSLGSNTCGGTLSAYANQCNTANYAAAVNASALCGHSDWQLPSLRALQSLVDFTVLATGLGGAPTIDVAYFPNTRPYVYWAANNYAPDPSTAWHLWFLGGNFGYVSTSKTTSVYVRLVRGGQ